MTDVFLSEPDAEEDQPKNPLSEDWLSVIIGLAIFGLALFGLTGEDALGWVVSTRIWTDPFSALSTQSKDYEWLGGFGGLVLTFIALLMILSAGAVALRANLGRFVAAFLVVFFIGYGCWFLGSNAHVAAVTPAEMAKFGVTWSLRLTNEGGYLIALVAGLVISNFFPRFGLWLKEAIRPELYIKIAIVILGGFIAVTAASKLNIASEVFLRGFAAIAEAYLIYWAVVYFVARKWFGFSREWAAPLASGISICGVAAAIATGGAIRARPQVPIVVSSLVVVFAVVEVLVLPFLAQTFLAGDPMVAAGWMGLAVKTDGAAVAAGGITDALILAKAAEEGIRYQPGWILATTSTVKVFIDVFIGIWAFVLAHIWTTYVNVKQTSGTVKLVEIYERFPKFIFGFLVTFGLGFVLALTLPTIDVKTLTTAVGEANGFRVIFFILTFFSIGVLSNFRKLWEDGIGKLSAIYFVCLFGFVIWFGLLVSWIFFHGLKPPLAS
jgi:uncharacterized membrane protein YadS